MNFWNTIGTGLKEIWAHKFRSLLTMLGIILGVASLVAMSAMVKGMENGLKEALVAAGGLDTIRVEFEDDLPVHQRHLEDQAIGLTMHDIHALKAGAPLVTDVSPLIEHWYLRMRVTLTHRGKRTRPYKFAGVWPDVLPLEEHTIEHGRMFNEIENAEARSVCVIGTDVRDDLFGDPDDIGEEINPVGETIYLNNQPLKIVGMFQHYASEAYLLKKAEAKRKAEEAKARGEEPEEGPRIREEFIFRLKNSTIYVPLNTMILKFQAGEDVAMGDDARLTSLKMRIKDVEQLESALQQARNVLLMTHRGLEDFAFRTKEDEAEEITSAIQNARRSGGIISAISLIVGGIGIMNIMLASISERVREIGIRKSVGATTLDVFVQIIVESVVIAFLGGLVGLAVSFGLVHAIGALTPESNVPEMSLAPMLVAFSCSVGIGVIAGLFPAVKASKLHPIQALRYD